MLLAHSSGLPAYEKLYLKARTRNDLLRAAFTTSLSTDPGTHAAGREITEHSQADEAEHGEQRPRQNEPAQDDANQIVHGALR